MAEGGDQNGDKTVVVAVEEQCEGPSELETKIIRQIEVKLSFCDYIGV